MNAPMKLLLIYVDENDEWEQMPLYEAIVRRLRRLGIAGATVQVGIMGFGGHSLIHRKGLILIQASSAACSSGMVAVPKLHPHKEAWMNFYTRQHKHYCGIDLHAKAMYVCILDQNGGSWFIKICRRPRRRFYDSLRRIGKTWSSASNVCSRGIGWRTCVRRKGLPLSWAMRSI